MAQRRDAAKLQPFDAHTYHVGIVIGLFNGHITKPMTDLALATLEHAYSIPRKHIQLVEVAGVADMPAVMETLARQPKVDCVLALGAIIKGETAHFQYVSKIVTEAVKDIQIKHAKPVAFGILITNNEAQAKKRIDHVPGFAAAAIHAARSIRRLNYKKKPKKRKTT